jgi:hypothetical protein
MAKWMTFNLAPDTPLRGIINTATLAEIHRPQVVARGEVAAPSPDANYAMGWFVDSYRSQTRLSHGGYSRDVDSEIRLFMQEQIGVIVFTNFGPPNMARVICQGIYDTLIGNDHEYELQEKLDEYETKIVENKKRISGIRHVPGTSPSHELRHYAGIYVNAGYGTIEIGLSSGRLILRRHELELVLNHWHFDTSCVAPTEMFAIHKPSAFDEGSRIPFETDADGKIVALSMSLEASVRPIRFAKENAST